MFYDILIDLCYKNKVKPADVSRDTGIGKSTIAMWKKTGATPSGETLQKLAEYFNVSVDYLLTGEKKEPAPSADQEVNELLEYYRTRPELKLLFSVTKNASPESIKRAAAIVEALEKEENSEE